MVILALGTSAGVGDPHGDAPAIDRVRISPTGDHVLAIAGGGGRRGLAVIDLATGELRIVLEPDTTSAFLESCDWASATRIVCSTYVFPKYTGVTHRQVGNGMPYQRRRLVRLVAVDYDGGRLVELIDKKPRRSPKMAGVARPPRHPLDDMEHVVVHHLPDEPDHVLIAAARDAAPYTSVYKVDLRTGVPVRVVGFELGILFWHADHAGNVRLGTGWYEFGHKLAPVGGRRPQEPWIGPTAVVRDGDGAFRRVDVSDLSGPVGVHDLAGPHVLGYSKDASRVYYEARVKGADRTALWEADAVTLAPLRRLAADGGRDVRAMAVAGRRCGVVGFMHQLPGRPFTWLDAAFGRDVTEAAARLAGEVVAVTSMSANCRRLVLAVTDGYMHRSFHLLDRGSGSLRSLGEQYPGIRMERPIKRRAVTYATRDGLDLPMTLTLPKTDGGIPPVVVLLDGGPARYSDDPLDTWPHFFASSGYVVAQPVFRGATGYGAALHQAGMRQRAVKLQTDVADALAWLAAEGVADVERACFAGRGKGGHLALAAALADGSPGESVAGRCVAAFAAMDMRSTRRDRGGPYGPCLIEPCDDWRRWAAPRTLSSFSAGDGFPGGEDASMLRSPLVDAEHPGFPVLIQAAGEAVVHEQGSRRFRTGLNALSTFEVIAPVGSTAEVGFLAAAEELFAEVLMSPESPIR